MVSLIDIWINMQIQLIKFIYSYLDIDKNGKVDSKEMEQIVTVCKKQIVSFSFFHEFFSFFL